jgi:PST family polysaccharide transporter
LDNISWLLVDKLVRGVLGFLIGIWLARYLGPIQFGQLHYAMAFVGLFGAVAALGLDGIVVRDLVRHPENANTTLGTVFFLMLVSGLIAAILVVATITWLRPEDLLTKTIVAILGFRLVFVASDVIRYWFQAQVRSKYTVWVENGVFLLISAVKVAMIVYQLPLIAFVWVMLLETILVSLALFGVYWKQNNVPKKWKTSRTDLILLFRNGISLILMTIFLGIYTKIDQVMINQILGDRASGIYAAAVIFAESWFFLAIILTHSIFPKLIQQKEENNELFLKSLTAFYALMFWIPVLAGLLIFILGDVIIELAYGQEYMESAPVLKTYVWAGVFVFVITASSRWFLITGNTRGLAYRALLGVIANISLNLVLINLFGLVGAALATLISYFLVAYVYDIFDSQARPQWSLKAAAIAFPIKLIGRIYARR